MRKYTYGHVWKMGTRHFVFIIIIIIIVGSAAAVVFVVCFGMNVQFMHRKKVGTTYCKDKFHFFLLPSLFASLSYSVPKWHIRLRIQHTNAHFFHLIRHLFTLNVFISWNINIYVCVRAISATLIWLYMHTCERRQDTLWKFVWIRMNTKSRKKVEKIPTTHTVTKCVDLKIKTMKQTMTNRSNNMQTKKAISLRVEFICVARINKQQQQQTLENVCWRELLPYCQNRMWRKRKTRDRHRENRKFGEIEMQKQETKWKKAQIFTGHIEMFV